MVLLVHRQPDVRKMLPSEALKRLTEFDFSQMQSAAAYPRRYALKTLLLSGIAPLAMGLYLMRSNNLFVRLCYPKLGGGTSLTSDHAAPPIGLSTNPGSTETDDKKSDNRYAPPGYFR